MRQRRGSVSTWLSLSLAALSGACGASKHQGDATVAGKGGSGGIAAASGGGQMVAGSSTSGGTNAGGRSAAGGVGVSGHGGRAGAGGSAGGEQAGRAAGGDAASGGGLSGVGGVAGSGGANGGAGITEPGGAGDSGASEGGVAGAAEDCGVGAPKQQCAAAVGSYLATLVDFSHYASDGTWTRASARDATGTTRFYHSESAGNLSLEVVDSLLHVSGTIPAGEYSGWVFVFDDCQDGELYSVGLTFPQQGQLGGTSLTLGIRTNADYPIDVAAHRGACAFTSCDPATIQSECHAPSYELPASSFTSERIYAQWANFSGGAPEHSTTGSELLGISFEFRCDEPSACLVDFALGNLTYLSL